MVIRNQPCKTATSMARQQRKGLCPALSEAEDLTIDRHGKATFFRRFVINFEQENIQAGISWGTPQFQGWVLEAHRFTFFIDSEASCPLSLLRLPLFYGLSDKTPTVRQS